MSKRFDEVVSRWLEDTAPARLPERVLDNTFEKTRRTRQQTGWRALLDRLRIRTFVPALGSAAVVVIAVSLAITFYFNQRNNVGPEPVLPSSITDWSRVSIDTRFSTAQLDTFAAGPSGLLGLVGELHSNAFQLAVAANGQDWAQVPDNQVPRLEGHHVGLAGTDTGFLMLVDNDAWTSTDGFTWDGLAGAVTDPDLARGDIAAIQAGGPGLVAVGGNNKAWHSTNGSDWSLADVPPLPAELERPGVVGAYVQMRGVAVSGSELVAWGVAEAYNGDEPIGGPVLWYSSDGLSWASARDLPMDLVMAVAGGPNGFVAIGAEFSNSGDAAYAAWLSADGRAWQKGDVLASLNDEGVPVAASVKAIAATEAGYVAVGAANQCVLGACSTMDETTPPMEAAIWTSSDGLSWSRLAHSDLFVVREPGDPRDAPGSDATSVAAWGSRFAIGGHFDGKPVVWISGQQQAGSGPDASATPEALATPTADEGPTASPSPAPTIALEPTAFLGTWISTSDVDGGLQIMTVSSGSAEGDVTVLVTDDIASVCASTPSTMTGDGHIDGNELVIPTPDYTCDDGSEPHLLNGDPTPLNEVLRNLTYVYDPETDTLSIGDGIWRRFQGTSRLE